MRTLKKTLIACMLLLTINGDPAAAEGNEADATVAAVHEAIFTAINSRDYASLESLASKYRTEKSRLPEGKWLLTNYYDAIDNILEGGDSEEKFKKWTETSTEWMAAYPYSPTPYVAHAIVLVKHAWKKRGSRYAEKVWKDDWAPFFAGINEARQLLERHKQIASVDPQWYAEMVIIYNALGVETPELLDLVREGTEKEPYYYPMYSAAFWYFSPQWHGDADKMDRWADIATEQTAAKDGQSMYARLYFNAHWKFGRQFTNRVKPDIARLRRATQDLLKKYPSFNNFSQAWTTACDSGAAEWAREQHAITFASGVFGSSLPKEIDPNGNCGWAVEQPTRSNPDVLKPLQATPEAKTQKTGRTGE